jgi:tricorn protease
MADGKQIGYLAAGGIRSMTLLPQPGQPTPVAFTARMNIDTRAELTQMFDEAWRRMRDSFYDEKMHGSDWNRVRDTYRPILEDISAREDFYALFALVLGELNASHIGLTPPASSEGVATSSLGVELDDSYPGPGVKVKSVMPRGPADKENARLNPGDFVLKVDGEPVENNEAYYRRLADRAGKRVEVLTNTSPKEDGAKAVKIRAVTQAAYKALEYDRWCRENQAIADKLSGGRLLYVHLNAMNETNLQKFRRAAYSDMEDRSGMVLDLRFNGGGSIADEIFQILETRVFGYRTQRGESAKLTAPLPAFDKPVIVLINEQSLSNAEVFPWGFKALKLGKVVGMPTYGAVIGTGGTTLIDGSALRIPAAGSFTLDGMNMENNGCPPDILVENSPEDIYRKQDKQLARAVEELLKDIR